MTRSTATGPVFESASLDQFSRAMAAGGIPAQGTRIALNPDDVRDGLGRLVLTLMELLRELLEAPGPAANRGRLAHRPRDRASGHNLPPPLRADGGHEDRLRPQRRRPQPRPRPPRQVALIAFLLSVLLSAFWPSALTTPITPPSPDRNERDRDHPCPDRPPLPALPRHGIGFVQRAVGPLRLRGLRRHRRAAHVLDERRQHRWPAPDRSRSRRPLT